MILLISFSPPCVKYKKDEMSQRPFSCFGEYNQRSNASQRSSLGYGSMPPSQPPPQHKETMRNEVSTDFFRNEDLKSDAKGICAVHGKHAGGANKWQRRDKTQLEWNCVKNWLICTKYWKGSTLTACIVANWFQATYWKCRQDTVNSEWARKGTWHKNNPAQWSMQSNQWCPWNNNGADKAATSKGNAQSRVSNWKRFN